MSEIFFQSSKHQKSSRTKWRCLVFRKIKYLYTLFSMNFNKGPFAKYVTLKIPFTPHLPYIPIIFCVWWPIIYPLLYILTGPHQLSSYLPLLQESLETSLRPSTARAYHSSFYTFLQFCSYHNYHNYGDVTLILAFLRFLQYNNLSRQSIQNYLCAIRHKFIMYDLNIEPLNHPKVALLLRSISINRPLALKMQGIIDINLLTDMVNACQILQFPLLFKSIYLTAFFVFLRISNLAPNTVKEFDVTRHLAKGDVILGSPGAHIIIKWAKCMQDRNQFQVVQIPVLKNVNLCPVTALVQLTQLNRGDEQSPLFNTPHTTNSVTQGQIRNSLDTILSFLKLPPPTITFLGLAYYFHHENSTFLKTKVFCKFLLVITINKINLK